VHWNFRAAVGDQRKIGEQALLEQFLPTKIFSYLNVKKSVLKVREDLFFGHISQPNQPPTMQLLLLFGLTCHFFCCSNILELLL
jgi:hypothetical protein